MKLEVTTVDWCPGIRYKIVGTKEETQGNNDTMPNQITP